MSFRAIDPSCTLGPPFDGTIGVPLGSGAFVDEPGDVRCTFESCDVPPPEVTVDIVGVAFGFEEEQVQVAFEMTTLERVVVSEPLDDDGTRLGHYSWEISLDVQGEGQGRSDLMLLFLLDDVGSGSFREELIRRGRGFLVVRDEQGRWLEEASVGVQVQDTTLRFSLPRDAHPILREVSEDSVANVRAKQSGGNSFCIDRLDSKGGGHDAPIH